MRGKRILILRPAGRAEAMAEWLEERGAIPVVVPALAIVPLDDFSTLDSELRDLASYDWVAITSVAGAESFSSRMGVLGLEMPGDQLSFAAIGPETKRVLETVVSTGVWMPSSYTTANIGDELPDPGRILLLRADVANSDLEKALSERGFETVRVDAYKTVPLRGEPIREAIASGIDAVALTSASIAHAFARAVGDDRPAGLPAIFCIGPPTAEACSAAGLDVAVVAGTHTTAGLIEAMENYFR